MEEAVEILRVSLDSTTEKIDVCILFSTRILFFSLFEILNLAIQKTHFTNFLNSNMRNFSEMSLIKYRKSEHIVILKIQPIFKLLLFNIVKLISTSYYALVLK